MGLMSEKITKNLTPRQEDKELSCTLGTSSWRECYAYYMKDKNSATNIHVELRWILEGLCPFASFSESLPFLQFCEHTTKANEFEIF